MNIRNPASPSRNPRWAKATLASAALAAVALAGGCTVHVHDREGEYEVARPRREVVVEQPVAEQPAPAVEVVYEPAPPEVVTVYEPELSPYGHWVTIGAYGRCWVFGNRPAGWRPYMNGHWVASDQGWLWVAEGEEASWGATCYHYGRWYEDPNEGWVWVPGRVWAPSWCAWRAGGGYSCWAPLPPECGDGYAITPDVVERFHMRPERFVSVRTQYISEVNIHEHIEVTNVTIINKTTNITRITYANNRAVNPGVAVRNVEAASGHRVVAERAKPVRDAEEARREVQAGHAVIYTPAAVESYALTHPVTKHPARDKDHETTGHETLTHQPTTPEGRTAEEIRAQREREAQEKLAQEKANHEKTTELRDDEKAAKEKAVEDHKAEERAAIEKAAQEKAAKEKGEVEERAAKEKALVEEREARVKAAVEEKAAKEKAAQDKITEERDAKEKAAQEKIAEKAAKEKETQDKIAQEKSEKLKAAEEKAAAEKAARDARNQGKPKTDNNDPNNPKKKPRQPGDNTPPGQQ